MTDLKLEEASGHRGAIPFLQTDKIPLCSLCREGKLRQQELRSRKRYLGNQKKRQGPHQTGSASGVRIYLSCPPRYHRQLALDQAPRSIRIC